MDVPGIQLLGPSRDLEIKFDKVRFRGAALQVLYFWYMIYHTKSRRGASSGGSIDQAGSWRSHYDERPAGFLDVLRSVRTN